MKRPNRISKHRRNKHKSKYQRIVERSVDLHIRTMRHKGFETVAMFSARPAPGDKTEVVFHQFLGTGNEEWLADILAEQAQLLTISTTKPVQTQSPGVSDERNDDSISDQIDPSKPEQASGALPPSPPGGSSGQETDPPSPNDHANPEPGSVQRSGPDPK